MGGDFEMPEMTNPFRQTDPDSPTGDNGTATTAKTTTTTRSGANSAEYRYEGLPLAAGDLPATTATRSPPRVRRKCASFRKFLWYFFWLALVYLAMLEAWVNLFARSNPNGFDPDEQRLGPFALFLLPLTPWIRYENRKATPVSSKAHVYQQVAPSNTAVAVMPDLLPYQESNLSASVDFRLGSELSGCTPKFVLTLGENKYLYKPNEHKVQVWDELVAFLVNKYVRFDRVPPVHPFELPFQDVQDAVENSHAVASLPFVKCNFDLPGMSRWLQTSQHNLIGTLQLMVKGVWKRSKTTQRARCKIGRWTDRPLSVFAQREINTRSLFDVLIGNYDRYNNDFVQNQLVADEDRVLVYIDQGSQANVTLISSLSFPAKQYCRLYWKPVQALRTHADDLTETIAREMETNEMTRRWIDEGLIDFRTHPTMVHLQDRVTAVLQTVDECVAEFGHDYVFHDTS